MTDIKMTDKPVCPHCGHEEKNAWEIDFGGVDGDTETTCSSCGEDYYVERMAIFYYTTEKIREGQPQ